MGRRTPTDPAAALSHLRRQVARTSPLAFGRTYLPHHFALPACVMHEEVNGLLVGARVKRGQRIAIAAPRGSAKSTLVSLAHVLWAVCNGHEAFILLISNTGSQANDLLAAVKQELEGNRLLIEDYPQVCCLPGVPPPPERWRASEIITRNNVRVSALGAGQKVRGRRHRQDRPTLILLDDIEEDEQSASPDRRRKLEEWFRRAVLQAGSATTNVIAIGTLLHYDGLLARLLDPQASPGWRGHTYRAVIRWTSRPDLWEQWSRLRSGLDRDHTQDDPEVVAGRFLEANREAMLEGTEVLWPEREDYVELMRIRDSDGPAVFDAEKQNEPVNPADCLFQPEWITCWDDTHATEVDLLKAMGSSVVKVGACDPSLGASSRSDLTAIITLAKDREGILYVLDAELGRWKPDEILDRIFEMHKRRDYRLMAVETNHFQKMLADEALKRSAWDGSRLRIEELRNTGAKADRIATLQPLIKAGRLRFSKRHHELIEQLTRFPKGKHDDAPDALEMAVRMADKASSDGPMILVERREERFPFSSPGFGWRNPF